MREENIRGIPKLDVPIYRIFTVNRLREIFAKRVLTLVKPERWEDPFENFLLGSIVRFADGEQATMEAIQRKLYGQCWTLLRESDALWQIYSPKKNGIRVRTTVQKLWNAFYDPKQPFSELNYWMGRMQYWSERKIRQLMSSDYASSIAFDSTGWGHAFSLLIKRNPFRHEKEVRLIYSDTAEKVKGGLFRVSIDPLAVFDELVFDPRMQADRIAKLGKEFQRRGFTGKIRKSPLYRKPAFIIQMEN